MSAKLAYRKHFPMVKNLCDLVAVRKELASSGLQKAGSATECAALGKAEVQ